MATDLSNNNSTILTTGGFRPNKKDTLLDARTIVNAKAESEYIVSDKNWHIRMNGVMI